MMQERKQKGKILVFSSREICYLSSNFFANQIGVLSDEVPVIVKTDRKVIGRFRCLYEIPETAMPGVLEAKIDHVILRSDEITIQVKLKAVTT